MHCSRTRAKNQYNACAQARPSRRFATIRLQQTTKSLATANIANPYRLIRTVNVRLLNDGLVVERLMRSVLVVVRGKLTTKMVQVFGAEHDEMVEALLLDRLNDSLDVRIHVRRADATSPRLDSASPQLRLKRGRQLAVAIVLDAANAQTTPATFRHKCVGLLNDPGFIVVHGGWRDDHLPGFQMDEDQHKRITDALDCHNSLRQKVALPKRDGMALEEFVPSSGPALRTWIKSVLPKNAFDSVTRNRTNPKFLQLAQNASVTPVILAGKLQHQPANLFGFASAATFDNFALPSGSFVLTNPPKDGAGRDDADQVTQHSAELRGEPHQPLSLGQGDRDPRRQLAPQDFVLDLQVLDLPGELGMRGRGNDHEQGLEELGHGEIRASGVTSRSSRHFGTPAPRRHGGHTTQKARRLLSRRSLVRSSHPNDPLINSRRAFSVNPLPEVS